MADRLKTERTLETPLARDAPVARRSRLRGAPWLVVFILLAATIWLVWRAFLYQEEGDPVGSAMLAGEGKPVFRLGPKDGACDRRRLYAAEPMVSVCPSTTTCASSG